MQSPDDPQIPSHYHSEYEERPFVTCTRCGEKLEDMPDGYQIVKYWHNGEVAYEYAICHGCHAGILEEISAESRQRLEQLHKERFDASRGRERCAMCGRLEDELAEREFSRTVFLRGRQIDLEILVCGRCTTEMQNLMSDQTRGVWRKFLKENFPTAPDEMLPSPVVVNK